MKNLMNTKFEPENIQEEILCKKIYNAQNSIELEMFANKMEKLLKDKVEIFAYRIKAPYSAIRSYRLANYKDAEKIHDLLGFLIVVEDISQIKQIKELIIKNLDVEYKVFNLLDEKEFKAKEYKKISGQVKENQYNERIFKDINTWLEVPNNLDVLLPPFSYNILCNKEFKDIKESIPVEIRIQTKEDFITTESYYYTIHKNDNIELNVKIPLLCMSFRLLRRMAKLNLANDNNLKIVYRNQIENIKNINKKFIDENISYVKNVLKEYENIITSWKEKQAIYQFMRK